MQKTPNGNALQSYTEKKFRRLWLRPCFRTRMTKHLLSTKLFRLAKDLQSERRWDRALMSPLQVRYRLCNNKRQTFLRRHRPHKRCRRNRSRILRSECSSQTEIEKVEIRRPVVSNYCSGDKIFCYQWHQDKTKSSVTLKAFFKI